MHHPFRSTDSPTKSPLKQIFQQSNTNKMGVQDELAELRKKGSGKFM